MSFLCMVSRGAMWQHGKETSSRGVRNESLGTFFGTKKNGGWVFSRDD